MATDRVIVARRIGGPHFPMERGMTKHDIEFLEWIEAYLDWYGKHSRRWSWLLNFCTVLSLLAAIISIVAAGVITPEVFSSWGRWLILGASTLAAMSTAILTQLKVREMKEARETALLETEKLFAYAKQKFDEFAEDRKRINQIKDEIRDRIDAMERDQLRRYKTIKLRPEERELSN
jgi:type VI protein secretion system component VasK